MHTEGHARKALDDLGVGLERTREIGLRVFAARTHDVKRLLVDIGGVARLIDVHVTAAGLDQAADDLALQGHQVGHEGVLVGVDRLGLLVVKALRHAVGANEAHLHRLGGERRHALVFFHRHVAREKYALEHRAAVRHRRALAVKVGNVPARHRLGALCALFVQLEYVLLGVVVTAHRQAEAVLKVEPADLAVGDHFHAGGLLHRHGLADAVHLNGVELLRADQAPVHAHARFFPGGRSQQAADVVGTNGVQGVQVNTSVVVFRYWLF